MANRNHLKRGVGFGCAFKNVGFSFGYQENCWASVELQGGAEIDKVIVYHAGADVGQGAHTVMAQMAAHAVDVPVEKVEMIVSDTAVTRNSGSTSASRMTFMAGNAIKGAAELALVRWQAEDRPATGTYHYLAPIRTMVVRGAPAIGVAAAFGMVLGSRTIKTRVYLSFLKEMDRIGEQLFATRPTAVNLRWAVERCKKLVTEKRGESVDKIRSLLEREAVRMMKEDIAANRAMGRQGQILIPDGASILTHCNAGALATAGYGTALGVVRAACEAGKKVTSSSMRRVRFFKAPVSRLGS